MAERPRTGTQLLEHLLAAPLSELRDCFIVRRQPVPTGLLESLEADPRNGARELARLIRERRRRNRSEGQRLHLLLKYESALWQEGFSRVAGVDEAGMAPLAGPVVAAAVILPRDYKLRGLDDSKKIHDESNRLALAASIKKDATAWAVGIAEVEDVDRVNIYHAGLLAMKRAVEGLVPAAEYALVDARRIPDCPFPQRGIINGDELSASIAAASIIAKTTRDQMMRELDLLYPGYGFASHKGYPTPEHYQKLEELGPTPIHRRSFGPVRRYFLPLFDGNESPGDFDGSEPPGDKRETTEAVDP